jgi:hypothetical protein
LLDRALVLKYDGRWYKFWFNGGVSKFVPPLYLLGEVQKDIFVPIGRYRNVPLKRTNQGATKRKPTTNPSGRAKPSSLKSPLALMPTKKQSASTPKQ